MLIALLSRRQSRFFATHLRNIEEIYRVKGQRICGMLTDRAPVIAATPWQLKSLRTRPRR
jgi:hypothetical protein